MAADGAKAELGVSQEKGETRLRFSGPLVTGCLAPLWRRAADAVVQSGGGVVADLSGVTAFDSAGAALLLNLRRQAARRSLALRLEGMTPDRQALLDLFDADALLKPSQPRQEDGAIAEVGERALRTLADTRAQIAFIGELALAMAGAMRHPRSVRWSDFTRTVERAGAEAVPIATLIGFLLGLIMAFQSAMPMRQFGADIFVADLVTLSLLRELGPLMTAIVLAGRSSSAFAAEIGTMKVNEEISALTTFGLDPVRFLVVPRVLAVIVVAPLLTIFANLAGLAGGGVVLLSLNFPLATYVNRVLGVADLADLTSGLAKSLAFGLVVAAVGCLRGLQTRTGASAVGDSTTRSVVGAILLIALVDGIFAVVFFALGI